MSELLRQEYSDRMQKFLSSHSKNTIMQILEDRLFTGLICLINLPEEECRKLYGKFVIDISFVESEVEDGVTPMTKLTRTLMTTFHYGDLLADGKENRFKKAYKLLREFSYDLHPPPVQPEITPPKELSWWTSVPQWDGINQYIAKRRFDEAVRRNARASALEFAKDDHGSLGGSIDDKLEPAPMVTDQRESSTSGITTLLSAASITEHSERDKRIDPEPNSFVGYVIAAVKDAIKECCLDIRNAIFQDTYAEITAMKKAIQSQQDELTELQVSMKQDRLTLNSCLRLLRKQAEVGGMRENYISDGMVTDSSA